jgi:hypothetical protein
MQHYIDSLQIYYNLQGKFTSNNAKILGNLGKLYQTMALTKKGVEKSMLFERAKEALFDSLEIREKVHGNSHKETLLAKILIASFHSSQGKTKEALNLLSDSLAVAEKEHGKE